MPVPPPSVTDGEQLVSELLLHRCVAPGQTHHTPSPCKQRGSTNNPTFKLSRRAKAHATVLPGCHGHCKTVRETRLLLHVYLQSNLGGDKGEPDPGQSAADRPDLVSRVFNLKLKAFLKRLGRWGIGPYGG